MSGHTAENDARFYAYHPPILDRAAEHGCLDEDVATGDPIVCGECVIPPGKGER